MSRLLNARMRVACVAMLGLLTTTVIVFGAGASKANAGVYITGSYGMDSTNVPLEVTNTTSASASIDVDIFSFLRIGVSYGLENSYSLGYRARASTTSSTDTSSASAAAATDQFVNPCATETSCAKVINTSKVVQRGAGLTLILWHGDTVMPYLMGGALIKTYVFKSTQDGVVVQNIEEKKGKLVPNVGAGIGFRLSKDFSLKASVTASPGQVLRPGDTQAQTIWDKKTSFGLSYQL